MTKPAKWLVATLALAIALSASLPFFAVHNPPARLASVFGEKILICSGDGFKWVTPADLQSGKEKPAPHSGDKCPLCYAARHTLVIAAAVPILALNYHPPALVSADYQPALISLYRLSPLHSRAPPYSFIG